MQGWMRLAAAALAGGLALPGAAGAATITLFQRAYNVDGTVTSNASPGGFADESGFDLSTGLGSISVSLSGAGAHSFDFFLDLEIDEASNTFFNEFGAANGAPAAGQSWEIDEPGFVFGDIYGRFLISALEGANGVPAGAPDDVSMALGWDFTLGAGESATIGLLVSELAPPVGFYLSQADPDSLATIYFSSTLTIAGGPAPTPEPGALALFGLGLAALIGSRRRRG